MPCAAPPAHPRRPGPVRRRQPRARAGGALAPSLYENRLLLFFSLNPPNESDGLVTPPGLSSRGGGGAGGRSLDAHWPPTSWPPIPIYP